MTYENSTIKRIEELFSSAFHIDAPDSDIDLLDRGILDSFQFVELLMQLEREFGFHVDIQTIDLDDLRSLERIATLVEKNIGSTNNAASRSSGGSAIA